MPGPTIKLITPRYRPSVESQKERFKAMKEAGFSTYEEYFAATYGPIRTHNEKPTTFAELFAVNARLDAEMKEQSE